MLIHHHSAQHPFFYVAMHEICFTAQSAVTPQLYHCCPTSAVYQCHQLTLSTKTTDYITHGTPRDDTSLYDVPCNSSRQEGRVNKLLTVKNSIWEFQNGGSKLTTNINSKSYNTPTSHQCMRLGEYIIDSKIEASKFRTNELSR